MRIYFAAAKLLRNDVLDAARSSAYLSATMNRLLLTLLALLTGFAAQVSPAQAAVRGGGEAEIASVQAVRAVRLAGQVAVSAVGKNAVYDTPLHAAAPVVNFAVPVPSVRIRIDRARE